LELIRQDKCPDCLGTEWMQGLSAGMSQNTCCANPDCGSRFNLMPFGAERISEPQPRKRGTDTQSNAPKTSPPGEDDGAGLVMSVLRVRNELVSNEAKIGRLEVALVVIYNLSLNWKVGEEGPILLSINNVANTALGGPRPKPDGEVNADRE
jgi:hypothetical protein